ncbi:MAG: hypothetical protein U0T81_04670 [Saprospiraceae bacterium]
MHSISWWTPQDNYLITGSTTILEVDHTSSEYDVFLIKVDSSLKLKFATIYEPFVEEMLVQLEKHLPLGPDGWYIIGVSTYYLYDSLYLAQIHRAKTHLFHQ